MNQEKRNLEHLQKKMLATLIFVLSLMMTGCMNQKQEEEIPNASVEVEQEVEQVIEQEVEQVIEQEVEQVVEIPSLDTTTLPGKMEAIYQGKPEDFPMLMGTEINTENMQWYLGTTEIIFEEGYASEAMISSIAHSIVLLRFENEDEANNAVETLKSTVDPRKWICVGVEDDQVIIASKGDLVVIILDPNVGELFHTNFLELE